LHGISEGASQPKAGLQGDGPIPPSSRKGAYHAMPDLTRAIFGRFIRFLRKGRFYGPEEDRESGCVF